MNNKPYLLGICGASGSGKTFLLNKLLERLGAENITLVSQDNYYRKLEDQVREPDGRVNFDHPQSFEMDRWVEDMRKLMAGTSIHLDEYTFNNPAHPPRKISYHPNPLIILEGLFIFYPEAMDELYDLKVFVEADEHIRLSRRLRRDQTERGYSMDSILIDYQRFVAPMYQQFIAPEKMNSDLIIPNNTNMDRAVEVLCHHLTQKLSASE